MSRLAAFGEGGNEHHAHLDVERFKGHPYEREIEFVPTSRLVRHREYDRETEPKEEGDTAHLDKITKLVAAEGVKAPLIVMYGQKDRRAYIGEGNHRLAAAKRLGITHLPVRVVRVSHTGGRGAKVRGAPENEHGYVPGDLRPSDIGLPTHKHQL